MDNKTMVWRPAGSDLWVHHECLYAIE